MGILAIVLMGLLAATCVGIVAMALRFKALRRRYSAIVSVEEEVRRLREEARRDNARLEREAKEEAARLQADAERMRRDAEEESGRLRRAAHDELARAQEEGVRIRVAAEQAAQSAREEAQRELDRKKAMVAEAINVREQLARLTEELQKVEGSLEDISFGLYKPHYNFGTPEQFKEELERVKDKQKEMVRAGNAASFAVAWTVGESRKEGERMQKQYSKLMLRAFNGESDAAIAKVSWNNATKMEERIRKAFDAINELGGVMTVSIAPAYRELKLAELRLEHELEERKREIAEEQRRIREQMRDEEKAQREAEKAQADAEAEELRFQKALDKAKVELSKVRGEEHARMNERILELQTQLADAHAKTVRAKSIAELTKAGYVYIISNIGSFGDNVFKIGMTRRLEPMDRVKELGDASVPFPFDVHAMVYADDAPALENLFHQRFKERSVNLINLRKEFFAIDLSEIEAFAKEKKLKIAFTKIAEAREFRESTQMRDASGATRARVRGESIPAHA
jgi:hypothetical protein